MSLTRAGALISSALVAALILSLAISAFADDPEPAPAVASAVWDTRPDSVDELADQATILVEAEVTAIEDGPDLVSDYPGDDPDHDGIPTQRITFDVVEVFKGQIAPTFKLFKTGSDELHVEGDPLYEIGERYMLFLDPQGEPGTYLPAAPDGRLRLDHAEKAEPVIAGPVGSELEGLTPEQVAQEAAG
jgi:hypothetical protein